MLTDPYVVHTVLRSRPPHRLRRRGRVQEYCPSHGEVGAVDTDLGVTSLVEKLILATYQRKQLTVHALPLFAMTTVPRFRSHCFGLQPCRHTSVNPACRLNK
jgi:hypothetical protein